MNLSSHQSIIIIIIITGILFITLSTQYGSLSIKSGNTIVDSGGLFAQLYQRDLELSLLRPHHAFE